MKQFFDTDKPVWRFFTKLACMVELNLLWLVCSLPIITFGASTAALYYTMLKVVRGEDYGLIQIFIRSFKAHLKQGSILGMIALAAGVLVAFDLNFYVIAPGRIDSIFQVFQLVIAILYLMVLVWLFPVLAKFDNTTLNIIQSAFFLSIRHFGYTLMMIATAVSITIIEFFYAPVLALWGMGLIAYVNCICARAVFAKYIPEEADPSHDELRELFPDEPEPAQAEPREPFPGEPGSALAGPREPFLDEPDPALAEPHVLSQPDPKELLSEPPLPSQAEPREELPAAQLETPREE